MARRLSHIVCGLVPLFFLLMVGTVAGGSPVASHQRTAGQHRDLIATGYDLVGEDGGVFVFNGNFYGSLPDNYKVAINGNHKLVSRILKAATEAEQTQLAKQAFDLALLSQGMLTGAELTEFVTRSVNLID